MENNNDSSGGDSNENNHKKNKTNKIENISETHITKDKKSKNNNKSKKKNKKTKKNEYLSEINAYQNYNINISKKKLCYKSNYSYSYDKILYLQKEKNKYIKGRNHIYKNFITINTKSDFNSVESKQGVINKIKFKTKKLFLFKDLIVNKYYLNDENEININTDFDNKIISNKNFFIRKEFLNDIDILNPNIIRKENIAKKLLLRKNNIFNKLYIYRKNILNNKLNK